MRCVVLRPLLAAFVLAFGALLLAGCVTSKRDHDMASEFYDLGNAYVELGKYDKAITEFSSSYVDQVESDFAAFTAAIASGRILAHEDASGAEGTKAIRHLTTRPGKKARPAKTE